VREARSISIPAEEGKGSNEGQRPATGVFLEHVHTHTQTHTHTHCCLIKDKGLQLE